MSRNSLVFLLFFLSPLYSQVKITQGSGKISVDINGRPFTEFFIGPETTKPYLHPVRAASGTIVSRHFPMEMVEGESKDHQHQRGLWFSHGDVNGVDFWGNEASYKLPNLGKIVLEKVVSARSGARSGYIDAAFGWLDPHGRKILTERRTMVFYSDPTLRIIDFDIVLTAVQKAKFGDTKEGTFAIRLAAGLEEPHPKAPASPPRTGTIVNSDGAKGEKNTWGKPANWVDYYGKIGDEPLGVAIFDHPSNPRHPTYWHVRSYGLFAANIFGLHDFLRDKAKDGSLTLDRGKSLRFRYRVVVHPGDYKSAGIASLYRDYAGLR